jgi:hypothetical protein
VGEVDALDERAEGGVVRRRSLVDGVRAPDEDVVASDTPTKIAAARASLGDTWVA